MSTKISKKRESSHFSYENTVVEETNLRNKSEDQLPQIALTLDPPLVFQLFKEIYNGLTANYQLEQCIYCTLCRLK